MSSSPSAPNPTVVWEAYFERLVGLQLDFETAETAIAAQASSPEALDRMADEELERVREIIRTGAPGQGIDPLTTWAHDPKEIGEFLNRTKPRLLKRLEDFRSRLRANHFVIRFAVFETFLKDVHRAALLANPQLLRPDRQIPLGKLVAAGQEEVVREEVEREVNSLDRMSPTKKSEYFRQTLGIDWFEGHVAPLLESTNDVRNSLLHVDPDRVVTKIEFQLMLFLTFVVPLATVSQAAVLFPGCFQLPHGMEEVNVRKFVLPKQASRAT